MNIEHDDCHEYKGHDNIICGEYGLDGTEDRDKHQVERTKFTKQTTMSN